MRTTVQRALSMDSQLTTDRYPADPAGGRKLGTSTTTDSTPGPVQFHRIPVPDLLQVICTGVIRASFAYSIHSFVGSQLTSLTTHIIYHTFEVLRVLLCVYQYTDELNRDYETMTYL